MYQRNYRESWSFEGELGRGGFSFSLFQILSWNNIGWKLGHLVFPGKIAAIIESCSRKRACVIYVRVNIGLSPFSSRVPEVEHGQDSSESCQPAAVHGRRNFLTPRPDTDYIRRSRRQPIKNEYKRKLPVRHNLLNFIFVSRMIFAFENDRWSKIDMFDKYANICLNPAKSLA